MPQRLKLARSVVSTAAGLDADQARLQVREERRDLVAPELLAQNCLAALVCTVDLEHVLRQIDANRRNLHGGRPFPFKWLLTLPLWHVDAVKGGGVHPIAYDQLPKHVFGRFSNAEFGPFGFFTAASAFVFLSGIASGRSYGDTFYRSGPQSVWRRLFRRMALIYCVNTSVLLSLLAMLHQGWIAGPLWEREFALFYQDPCRALARCLMLLYRPGYFDILPMYIVFLASVPVVLWARNTLRQRQLMMASLLLWIAAQAMPARGEFNPLGYQILFVIGCMIGASRIRFDGWQEEVPRPILIACAIIAGAAFCCRHAWGTR